jgi:dihydrodipicolinate synthase/N-acetylneuraminate lyase
MTDIIENKPTAEEIARHYSAAMDSVNLINSEKPEQVSDEEWADTIKRNKEHLNIMLAKDFWTTEDLTPLQDAAK